MRRRVSLSSKGFCRRSQGGLAATACCTLLWDCQLLCSRPPWNPARLVQCTIYMAPRLLLAAQSTEHGR